MTDALTGAAVASAVLAAGYAGFQWLVPKAWDEWTARAKANNAFAEKTGDSVVELAKRHYWALANTTGTLSAQLDEYLLKVEAHLFLLYEDGAGPGEGQADRLRLRMDELAGEAAGRSFPWLVRTVIQFEQFQFRGSQTYLLPHLGTGRTLRQLYNLFAGRLPEGEFLTQVRRGIARHLKDEPKAAGGESGPGLSGPFLELPESLKTLELDVPRGRYERWLREDLASVSLAADALRAFAQVLGHELALLHRLFYRDRGRVEPASEFGLRAIASPAWPGAIGLESLPTLRRAETLSDFFVALGSSIDPPATARARMGGVPPAQDAAAVARDGIDPPPSGPEGPRADQKPPGQEATEEGRKVATPPRRTADP